MTDLSTWALVRVHTAGLAQLIFEPVKLQVDAATAASGQALWVAGVVPDRVGLAFPWACIPPGVVVLSDALALTTNALFVDDGGVVAPRVQLLCCASLLHRLPWQEQVQSGLRQVR